MEQEVNKIIQGDCIKKIKQMPENSVDAIITDPPYGLEFMGKSWDKFKKSTDNIETCKNNPYYRSNIRHRIKAGISQPALQQFCFRWATECLRVLKPGGFLLSFGGTRTHHRLVCGIEDAGFEIRDTIMWLYGSGFPKSLNIGKQIDKLQGNEREVVGIGKTERKAGGIFVEENEGKRITTKENSEYEGWGTALKPAVEPIVVARKPLSEKNVALNVLKWGTGGINIDACRINSSEKLARPINQADNKIYGKYEQFGNPNEPQGRFPANIILDEQAGKMLDEQSGKTGAFAPVKSGQKEWGGEIYHKFKTSGDDGKTFYDKGKLGGASRFFYCAKASKSEKELGCEDLEDKEIYPQNNSIERKDINFTSNIKTKNNHPTVKPIKLMEYLIKLVSREGAMVLDPFIGSGTTAIACLKLNRKFIGIEKEEEYVKIAKARIKPFMKQNKLNDLVEVKGEDGN